MWREEDEWTRTERVHRDHLTWRAKTKSTTNYVIIIVYTKNTNQNHFVSNLKNVLEYFVGINFNWEDIHCVCISLPQSTVHI